MNNLRLILMSLFTIFAIGCGGQEHHPNPYETSVSQSTFVNQYALESPTGESDFNDIVPDAPLNVKLVCNDGGPYNGTTCDTGTNGEHECDPWKEKCEEYGGTIGAAK